jgi:hypothetical protein
MLSSRSVMQRPSSEPSRPSLPLSLAAQERPKIQTKMILRKRMARERSCLPPPRASHRVNEVKPPLPMWTSWKRSAILPFFLSSRAAQHGLNPKQPAVDFFGRLITTPTTDIDKPESSRKQAKPAYVVSFRFKVGSSAAVRKPVKMASFL